MKMSDPRQLAIDLTNRSVCSVRVAAVIWDANGIFAWGWNSSGANGLGEHAEIHAIRRANRARLANSSIAVAGRRKANNVVVSFPCANCTARLVKLSIAVVWIEAKSGVWQQINL
jgi:deoxycytidylate deaminase